MRRSVRVDFPVETDGVQRHATPQLSAAALSDPGCERSLNEDSLLLLPLTGGGLFAVADGMGGHAAGDVASQLAVERLREAYQFGTGVPPERLARAVAAANLAVFQHATGSEAGMGTTLAAVVVDGGVCVVANVGDSRVYRYGAGSLRQLTRDHSWVAEQVRLGFLTEEEARAHQWRNVVSNALGGEERVRLDLVGEQITPGDRLLVCSDGLTAVLEDADVEAILARPGEAASRVTELVALANARGGPDNITVVLIDILEVTHRTRYPLPSLPEGGPVEVRALPLPRSPGRFVYAALAVVYIALLGMIILPEARLVFLMVGVGVLAALVWRATPIFGRFGRLPVRKPPQEQA